MKGEVSDGGRPGRLRWALGVGLGLGYFPVAPGTFGSLLGIAVGWPLWWLGGWPALLIGTIVGIVVGTWAAQGVADSLGQKDPRLVVSDEVAGQMVALLLFTGHLGIRVIVVSFLIFRILDIVKPPPARQAEALPGGFGIMMDDVVAGAYANLAVQVLIRLFPGFLGAA